MNIISWLFRLTKLIRRRFERCIKSVLFIFISIEICLVFRNGLPKVSINFLPNKGESFIIEILQNVQLVIYNFGGLDLKLSLIPIKQIEEIDPVLDLFIKIIFFNASSTKLINIADNNSAIKNYTSTTQCRIRPIEMVPSKIINMEWQKPICSPPDPVQIKNGRIYFNISKYSCWSQNFSMYSKLTTNLPVNTLERVKRSEEHSNLSKSLEMWKNEKNRSEDINFLIIQ